MNVVVINAGSSSLKYQFLNVDTHEIYAKGTCERIGIDGSFIGHEEFDGGKVRTRVDLPNHAAAAQYVLDILLDLDICIDGIGHRVVQGGPNATDSMLVTEETLEWVRNAAPLAPLHNPGELAVIEYCLERMGDTPNVIVCDTAFHATMPERAWRYALPRDVCNKLHIRKYGYHGTSHRYIWRATDEFTAHSVHKLVSCHLGSGASLSAIQDGRDLDTTMGLTPLDGLIMGTRCGSIDAATVLYLQREGGYSVDEIDTMLNEESGLLALSGISSDARDIERAADEGDTHSQLAMEMFSYRTAQLIMQMCQALEGVDALAFSAGIGENSPTLRAQICERLAWIGVAINPELNDIRSDDVRDISADDSKIRVLVVPTDEEYMIALDVQRLLID